MVSFGRGAFLELQRGGSVPERTKSAKTRLASPTTIQIDGEEQVIRLDGVDCPETRSSTAVSLFSMSY